MASSVGASLQSSCKLCGISFSRDIKNILAESRLCQECTYKSRKTKEGFNTNQRNDSHSTKLFPNPEKFHRSKVPSTPSLQIKNAISKRPLRCPYFECAKFVGVFDIEAHFKYEHKEVPHILTHLDVRNALEFSPKEIKRGRIQTLLLLNLNVSASSDMKTSMSAISKFSRVRLKENQTLLVLATKLTDYELDENLSKKTRQKGDEILETDKWIIWLSSNISTNWSCTIAVSALDNATRLKYFGPVVHMEEDYVKIWENGRCLVLNRVEIERISENFQKNLNLDIIIYSEE